ncbi:vacuolar protein sorting-associated protein 52 homolog isoform X3 [Amphibalanus amphitrite]|uniref:vacuolar protein sorting-associated protein 52 homolog isoform X3 n=1 Tax=Amphibalanus amphitrite TaxID=1232801 RepID=UPI001C9022FC|nr:vacuolar protein sorting-associated protein 52 homolog isoform X3 [Amphibalanus amphitrite]
MVIYPHFKYQRLVSKMEDEINNAALKEALESGIDLRQYSTEVEQKLRQVENASIQDYIKESRNITELHGQITACDEILDRMESMLQTFQSDLGSISSEIVHLQQQSVDMNLRLKNRQAVRGQLSQFVDDMTVPEAMIRHILETPVTEREFLEQLFTLDHKLSFVKEQSFREAKSCHDVSGVLEKLKIKAIAKIREYLLQKVQQFRKPMTNFQVPQNAMLKHKFFYKFLVANEREVAREIRDDYIETMSKVYFSYFKSYSTRLMKLQFEEGPTKDDLLAADEAASRSLFGKPSLRNRSTVFSVGSRGEVLNALEAAVLVPHAAHKADAHYPLESLFRSIQYALVDNACREYLFLTEFFMVHGNAAQDLFASVMGKTLHSCAKSVDATVTECHDSIALFLCIHLVLRYQLMCHKRAVPALDKYWDMLLNMLWPKFCHIMELNIASVRQCDPSKIGTIDVRPHYITRRYAEFSAALVGINESFPSERVHRLLAQLQAEMESLVLRLAAEFRRRKEQLIFLINNYDMMLGVIMERTKDNSKESETFRELLAVRTAEYVEETLSPHFGGLMQFVRDAEAMVERGDAEALKREERRITELVRSFSAGWKKSLEEINNEIMRSFTNFRNGTNILQDALKQLILYYNRFTKILGLQVLKSLPARGEAINIHHIMVEVKKYKPNF